MIVSSLSHSFIVALPTEVGVAEGTRTLIVAKQKFKSLFRGVLSIKSVYCGGLKQLGILA